MKPLIRSGLFLFIFCTQSIFAMCTVLTSSNEAAIKTGDPISIILNSTHNCPVNVLAFRKVLKTNGLQLEPSMVANRGFHNPSNGSFSLFEIVSGTLSKTDLRVEKGDFFFGHFITATTQHQLILDQTPAKNALMIEAFAWDPEKKLFQFYELRGDGKQGQWYYRGSSADIILDNSQLHRQTDPATPEFGNRLRCSACHSAGGPIMKELAAPHNDWWEPIRKLDFGNNIPDADLQLIMDTLVPADKLKESVIAGIKKLESIPVTTSLQEQLRPLFCPVELNLMSDNQPNNIKNNTVEIPNAFFIDPHFFNDAINPSIQISRKYYREALALTASHFPETTDVDADHAWLTPVKAYSDELAIDQLINNKIIDEKFAYDVLSIDMTNPVTSSTRCNLLKFVPSEKNVGWKEQFKYRLAQSSDPAAKILLQNMSDKYKTPHYYQKRGKKYLTACQKNLAVKNNVINAYYLLIQRRNDIKYNEISKNPRGQILEPGFRVIFPESDLTKSKWSIDENCNIANDK